MAFVLSLKKARSTPSAWDSKRLATQRMRGTTRVTYIVTGSEFDDLGQGITGFLPPHFH